MDISLAQKIQIRHKMDSELVQLWRDPHDKQSIRYRRHLKAASLQHQDWSILPKPTIAQFYARPLVRFMEGRQANPTKTCD